MCEVKHTGDADQNRTRPELASKLLTDSGCEIDQPFVCGNNPNAYDGWVLEQDGSSLGQDGSSQSSDIGLALATPITVTAILAAVATYLQ